MKLATTHAVIGAALLLVGCASVGASPSDSAPAGSNRPVTSAIASSSPVVTSAPPAPTPAQATSAAAPAPTPSQLEGVATFGKTYTYKDGLSVTVSAPAPFKPSSSAAGVTKGTSAVVFTITIVNKTTTPFDPVLFHTTAQSGNTEATSIFDSQNGIGLPPSTKLLPGREVTFKTAFSVADPKDIVMEVTPSFQHESVLYSS